jgi:hypothetical protein
VRFEDPHRDRLLVATSTRAGGRSRACATIGRFVTGLDASTLLNGSHKTDGRSAGARRRTARRKRGACRHPAFPTPPPRVRCAWRAIPRRRPRRSRRSSSPTRRSPPASSPCRARCSICVALLRRACSEGVIGKKRARPIVACVGLRAAPGARYTARARRRR